MIKTATKQRTIAKEVTLTGVGLHTGENVTLKFVPARRILVTPLSA